jgi:rhodanese-related sulfurtransferase
MTTVQDITHEDMKRIVDDGQAVLVDCNGATSFSQAHIPGAIDFSTDKDHLKDVLPLNRDTPVIVYCGSEQCHAYESCAQVVMDMGFTNVIHYAPGIKGWVARGERTESAADVPTRH